MPNAPRLRAYRVRLDLTRQKTVTVRLRAGSVELALKYLDQEFHVENVREVWRGKRRLV